MKIDFEDLQAENLKRTLEFANTGCSLSIFLSDS